MNYGPRTCYSSRDCILVSYCCCNKLPQTLWLGKTQIYFSYSCLSQKFKMGLTELKSSVIRAVFLSEALGENLFPCLFQL